MFSLSPDTYSLIIQQLRLSDIIKLTIISHKIRIMTLAENNWCKISDTAKILKKFIANVLKNENCYPYNQIECMYNTNLCDAGLLKISFNSDADFVKFYSRF